MLGLDERPPLRSAPGTGNFFFAAGKEEHIFLTFGKKMRPLTPLRFVR